jgi:hypothetical protein
MKQRLEEIIKDYYLIDTTNQTFYKRNFFILKHIEELPENHYRIMFENMDGQTGYDIYLNFTQVKEYIDNGEFQYMVHYSDGITYESFHKGEIEIVGN